ncbi:MAG: Gx transporter family protein, partial [Lachnospiraceae bacterium]|nr:Gx transporter family protein [Lachnospiraceae bacterium]
MRSLNDRDSGKALKGPGRIAMLTMLAASAIILGYVESLIPINFGIPGVKAGLCNIVILLALLVFSWKEALLISVVRILVTGFMFGNLFSISYSLAGTACSILIMTLLIKTGRSGIIGISASGGAMHGLGQLMVARIVLPALPFAGYASILIFSGIVT